MSRHGLYVFRHEKKLTQDEMAEKIGCSRVTYSNIETGKRNGKDNFWQGLQKAFDVPDSEMYQLMKKGGNTDCEKKEK